MLPDDNARLRPPVVLITRPEGQQLAFATGCEALGYTVALLPCLQILPCNIDQTSLDVLLERHDTALFTSANAVRFAHRIRPLPWPGQQVHAIGAATAKALVEHNQAVALVPQAPFNSEAYLEQITDQPPGSLLIVKGHGGRDLVQTRLDASGWQVSAIAVYKRAPPVVSDDTIDALFAHVTPDIISVTSDETLTNLWALCHRYTTKLQLIPLIVNSQRCARLALELGFQRATLVANPAGDQGQLACLALWKKTEFDSHQP